MKIKEVDTYQATISLGLREGYTDVVHSIDEVLSVCQSYCDSVGLCVTVTPTTFVYTNGNEKGCFIGLINYPRFPSSKEKINEVALELAKMLTVQFRQNKVSIICSDKTYMIELDERKE